VLPTGNDGSLDVVEVVIVVVVVVDDGFAPNASGAMPRHFIVKFQHRSASFSSLDTIHTKVTKVCYNNG
jgi:hypothetical protein